MLKFFRDCRIVTGLIFHFVQMLFWKKRQLKRVAQALEEFRRTITIPHKLMVSKDRLSAMVLVKPQHMKEFLDTCRPKEIVIDKNLQSGAIMAQIRFKYRDVITVQGEGILADSHHPQGLEFPQYQFVPALDSGEIGTLVLT